MKKLNKKGFVMVETLIVTAFVMALFVLVYQSVIPFMGEYEQISSYDDIDSIYASNLWKQLVIRYANTKYIDEWLENNTYLEIKDCDYQDRNTNEKLYINASYCKKLKESLEISDSDYIFITKYNISSFRNEVNQNDYFDSGDLSNFRSYLASVSDTESFYSENNSKNLVGKYRLFVTRTITQADSSTTRKYTNIGVYTGSYQKYVMGEEIVFNPGDGDRTFYVLKNSPSTEDKVTLILADNLSNSNVAFNSTNTAAIPDTVLAKLKAGTESWTNVDLLEDESYTSLDGYTISYSGYRSRLLDENDIMEVLGCKEDNEICFDYQEAFTVNFDVNQLGWLISNLNDNSGYWTSATIPKSDAYAWSVQKGKISPTLLTENTNVGVRPVITVAKEKLK